MAITVSKYKVKRDFRAPKANLGLNEMQSYRSFQKGSSVEGYVNGTAGKDLLFIEGGYVLPMDTVEHEKDLSIDGQPIPEKPIVSETDAIKADVKKRKGDIPAEYREEMERIKNMNVVGDVVSQSRNSVNGMLIGAGIGLLFAVLTGNGKMLSMIVGATGGGFIGYKWKGTDKKKSEFPEKKTKTETKTEPNGK
jgi:F0F1-type ATP synthase assembly protein I